MKIRGGFVLALALWAPLVRGQGASEQQPRTPLPPSSGAFAADSAEPAPSGSPPAPAGPTPAVPVVPSSSAPESGASAPMSPPEGTVAPEAADSAAPRSKEPRAARVIAAPSNELPDAAESEEPGLGDEEELHKRGHHVHDGFYLRLGLGAGYLMATSENDSTFKGWGIAPDVWIGGSPTPGLAIGVTFNGISTPDPYLNATAADTGGLGAVSGEAPGTLTYSVFGVFADYYPNPTGGFHLMAGLNYSLMKFEADNGLESDAATGVGLTGGLGYEWWIGNEWSVGPLARLHWASVSDVGGQTSVLAPVFLLGFTYH